MRALNLCISHGALQDSAARDPPPRCLPGTRKKEKETIMSWIEKPNPRSSVFLIQGRTRIEETAFMQTIAERLQAEDRQPYACFFFQRGVVGCDNMDQLFLTLAYQLAINFPRMRERIEQAMMEDPALPMRSAATQLQKLIITPFKLLPTPRSSSSLVLIIDGLDECEGKEPRDAFLALISQVLEDSVTIQFIVSGLQGQEYERVRSMGAVSFWITTLEPNLYWTRSLYTCPSHPWLFFF